MPRSRSASVEDMDTSTRCVCRTNCTSASRLDPKRPEVKKWQRGDDGDRARSTTTQDATGPAADELGRQLAPGRGGASFTRFADVDPATGRSPTGWTAGCRGEARLAGRQGRTASQDQIRGLRLREAGKTPDAVNWSSWAELYSKREANEGVRPVGVLLRRRPASDFPIIEVKICATTRI